VDAKKKEALSSVCQKTVRMFVNAKRRKMAISDALKEAAKE